MRPPRRPFLLSEDEISFPPSHLATKEGVLAVGGDLSVERLLLAYRMGIFPWYSEGDPIIWWSPDPRLILLPNELRISHSMRQVINRKQFTVTFDTCFRDVIMACSGINRPDQPGTWITPDMVEAYCRLHVAGYAHSVEAWLDGTLAGGLYGVSVGGAFFGESMFTRVSNASKFALIRLAQTLDFSFIDCQVHTPHLESLGAKEIPRQDFLEFLQQSLQRETRRGNWSSMTQSC